MEREGESKRLTGSVHEMKNNYGIFLVVTIKKQ